MANTNLAGLFWILLLLAILEPTISMSDNTKSAVYQKLKGRSKPLKLFTKSLTSNGQQLQQYYSDQHGKFFDSSKRASSPDIDEALNNCATCGAMGDVNFCYADCITKKYGKFQDLAENIAKTVVKYFCKPMGFGFFQYLDDSNAPTPGWIRFKNFTGEFKRYENMISWATLVESWLSNVIYLEGSPLYFYTLLRVRMLSSDDVGEHTPPSFAATCDTRDNSAGIANLIVGAKDMTPLIDILLRGFFTIRSAFFYTFGSFQNLMGSMLEGLETIAGRKCDLITYSLGEATADCDNLGQFPFPHFPLQEYLEHLVTFSPDCY